jgi:hypothetical protein
MSFPTCGFDSVEEKLVIRCKGHATQCSLCVPMCRYASITTPRKLDNAFRCDATVASFAFFGNQHLGRTQVDGHLAGKVDE